VHPTLCSELLLAASLSIMLHLHQLLAPACTPACPDQGFNLLITHSQPHTWICLAYLLQCIKRLPATQSSYMQQ
jgi:hypothetical protein